MKCLLVCLFPCLCLLISEPCFTQNDSTCRLRIAVLTCSPGQDLYSLFGHNALRITDSSKGSDVIYNWGTFDFEEPNFYVKFMRGKLMYFLSPDRVQDFVYAYQYERRSVTEQVLDLTCNEKIKIKHAVDANMQGNNRFYKYDFLFDNCTTRIRDILEKNGTAINVSGSLVVPGTTFRNMIHFYLDQGSQPWSKLGIDILLGSRIDKPVTNEQAMFLPEYLMKAIDSSVTRQQPIVEKKGLLVTAQPYEEMVGVYKPLIATSAISLVLLCIGLLKANWAKRIIKFSDTLLLYLTGLIGLLLLFMWFFTDHSSCDNNYNIAWALPTNFIVAFTTWKKPAWTTLYFKTAAFVTILLLLSWFWIPQEMNMALLPISLYLLYRYVKLANG